LNTLAWVLAVVAIWLWTWHTLAFDWRRSIQYEHGFLVPCLGVILAWMRLKEMPVHAANGNISSRLLVPLMALGMTIFSFAEILRQSDPAWHLGGGLMMLTATTVTGLGIYQLGGKNLLRPLTFPVLFQWLAMPWPKFADDWLVTGLTRFVSSITVDLLNFSGHPATILGNVIQIKNGFVGVDTACSGVHSFQASLMAAVFVGGFYQLTFVRRLGLILAGWSLAILFNAIRVFMLAYQVATSGPVDFQGYHDLIGTVATLAIFGGLLAVSYGLRNKRALSTSDHHGVKLESRIIPGYAGWLALCIPLVAPAVAAGWFAIFDQQDHLAYVEPHWNIRSDHYRLGWQQTPIDLNAEERRALNSTQSTGKQLSHPSGYSVNIFHHYWNSEARPPATAFVHTPNICMSSGGWQSIGVALPLQMTIHGQVLSGAAWHFQQNQEEIYVFQCILPKPFFGDAYDLPSRFSRLQLLWQAPRQRVAEMLQVYVTVTQHMEWSEVAQAAMEAALEPARSSQPPSRKGQ
jgi:exosortase